MATVTGITVEKAQEIENASIVNGQIQGGNLYLETKGGAQINAGQVVPNLPPLVASWPIGTIYISVVDTSPAVLLGGGVWARVAQGRVLVSHDATQTEFNAARKIGGEKTHTMTVAELAQHGHGLYLRDTDAPIGVATGLWRKDGGEIDASSGNVANAAAAITSAGSSTPFNVMQPYFTVFMWERTG